MSLSRAKQVALNGICPYFTMFPLDFPLNILKRRARRRDYVLDPFCGRGTTNFAARILGLNSLGVDSSPVATAITASKLVATTVDEILAEARNILTGREACQIPKGEFWQWAYHPAVLNALCQFREAFLEECSTARIALRGIVLGALHGPKQKTVAGYFSNQCPRTYAPKPAYATRYWQSRGMFPGPVDVLAVIERRAKRYYRAAPTVTGAVRLADSRIAKALQPETLGSRFNWVITSPHTTVCVPISQTNGCATGLSVALIQWTTPIEIRSFTQALKTLRPTCVGSGAMQRRYARMMPRWLFVSVALQIGALTLLILPRVVSTRVGGASRRSAKLALPRKGKRQADTFLRTKTTPLVEYDIRARRQCRTVVG